MGEAASSDQPWLDLSRMRCLGEWLRDAAYAFASEPALIEAHRQREAARYSYRQWRLASETLAARLQALGVQPGDRVAILMQNQAKWLISATAALWSGAVLVPLDYKLSAPEQRALIAHSRPAVLIAEHHIVRGLLRVSGGDALGPSGLTILATEAPEGALPASADTLRRWEEDLPEQSFELRHRERSDTACIVYSSGTSGTPRGCRLSHHCYLSQAEVLGRLFPLQPGDRYFSILPTNHAIDFMCGFLIPLTMGAAVVHQRTLRPQFLGPTIKRYRITHMSLVPALLKAFQRTLRERLDELPRWQRNLIDSLITANEWATDKAPNHALSKRLLAPIHARFGGHLKLIFAGGAFVEEDLARFFYRLGIPVVIGYGLTEACTVITVNDLQPFRGDTVGRPIPRTQVEIRDADAEGVGEVWVRGPTLMDGYLDDEAATADVLVDGWLRTGDLGLLDAAGHLKLLGRRKNMIVSAGGKNIYPEDVEALLGDVDGVEELCVFAADFVWRRSEGAMRDEQLIVALRLADDAVRADVLDALTERNRRLPEFKRLSSCVLVERDFPRTASMKVKRGLLRERLAALPRDEALVSL